MKPYSDLIFKYMRIDHLPHIWCPGCGNGILMRNVAVAIEELQIPREQIVVVSGIGCSSRAAGYLDVNTIHTTHGRALAFATGIKLAKPELHVIVITGDGDCTAIGGNHLIHAARRNIDLTVVVFNNNIYGMTGGQYSPTTPRGDKASTAPYGNLDRAFDIAQLAAGAGASFTGRGTAYHVNETTNTIMRGIRHKGFSLIDCYSVCPTYYGRKNKKGSAVEMMQWQKEHGVPVERYNRLSEEEKADKFPVGILTHTDYPEFTQQYQQIIDRCMAEKKERQNNGK